MGANLPWLAVALWDGSPRSWGVQGLAPPAPWPPCGVPPCPTSGLSCGSRAGAYGCSAAFLLPQPAMAPTAAGADLLCTGPFCQQGAGLAQGQERQVWGSPRASPPQSQGADGRCSAPGLGSAPVRARWDHKASLPSQGGGNMAETPLSERTES